MAETRQIEVKAGDVLLMVGTTKGAFLFRADGDRKTWERGGPHFPGSAVYAMALDQRQGRHRLWAGPENAFFGPSLRWSDDFGREWAPAVESLRFPEDTGGALKQVWQVAVPDAPAGRLYCGVQPAALFVSEDAGESWSLVRGLWDHPHRVKWEPGNGGLCLHTVLPPPGGAGPLYVAISTGGVYRSDDAGATWRTAHKGVRAQFLPDKYPEFGQCVHKVTRHPSRPERLFLQNHWGLYRTDDGGENWMDIANGVPSDFGFAMAAHPHKAETVYVVPLESDEFRAVPEGRLRVYRTDDAGASWHPHGRGLPEAEAFEVVLRDGLCVDSLDPAGVYFGTRSGKVLASADEGESWQAVAAALPPVTCVKAAVVA